MTPKKPPKKPPHYPGPIPLELVLSFLDAVARKTDAFRELRDEILPLCASPIVAPLAMIDAWLSRWHLNSFADLELNDRIHAWVFEIIDYWRSDSRAADALRVDCGWVASKPAAPRPPSPVRYDPYDDRRESPAAYKKRMVTAWRKLIVEEITRGKEERQAQSLLPPRRDRGRDPREDFEWLALFLCRGLSDAEIAQLYKIPGRAGMVKKARQRLYLIGFEPAGT